MKIIDGLTMRRMVLTAAILLDNHHPEVDALNVFPVPDGDTGTNMSLTFNNGAEEVKKLPETASVFDVTKALSRGLLMGARGNSGVIMSQIFRGFSKSLKGKTDITAVDVANAFADGSKVAYKAVMRPVEGTILTVIRESSEAGVTHVQEDMDIEEWFDFFVQSAEETLNKTPELLPVLKEVGVVDSGGSGLLWVFKGFIAGLKGESIEKADTSKVTTEVKVEEKPKGYNTHFLMRVAERKMGAFNLDSFTKELERLPAKDLNIQQREDLIDVQLLTKRPGHAVNAALRYGDILKINVANVAVEDEEVKYFEEEELKEVGIIAVAAGEGVKNLFMELHCDGVVSGGQTMNPATEDLVAAIKSVKAAKVIVLPNNSNIVMTANQAADVLADEIEVFVIPSKTVPQGLSACLMYNEEESIEDNIAAMEEAVGNVKTGQVTFAIKDTQIDGVEIKANQYMALCDKQIKACVPDKIDALKETIKGLVDEESEIMTLICGEDITEDERTSVTDYLNDVYPDIEIDVIDGKQPVYSFIIGVE
ncbi:MAG: DAK2 domain-containing protein [Erysipelotrichaceae bacterium]|nr:DAK2 domain-containing protein [Erysipelotrichaceae bacterium]